ncbi:MAG: hypothetical protein JSR58_07745 [Verrucomicrobia bacterium]|nr:hypothetical protein [Verrucomicrobiota bacterium]
MKSERLKKLETELQDLEQWLKLGLVPKKDLEKHKVEITALKDRISEEKERLRFLKESGAMEEFVPPKRPSHARQAFPDTASMPDIDLGEENMTDAGLDMESETYDYETTSAEETEGGGGGEEEEEKAEEEEEEDPFSDRNRWRRGVMEDPDADNW